MAWVYTPEHISSNFPIQKSHSNPKRVFFWLCKSISVQDKNVGSVVGADSDRDTIAGFIAGILQKYSNNKGEEEEEEEVSGPLKLFFGLVHKWYHALYSITQILTFRRLLRLKGSVYVGRSSNFFTPYMWFMFSFKSKEVLSGLLRKWPIYTPLLRYQIGWREICKAKEI